MNMEIELERRSTLQHSSKESSKEELGLRLNEIENTVKLELNELGQIFYTSACEDKKEIFVRRCFPWSAPNSFISLVNENGEEVFLVEELRQLSPISQEALEHAIIEQGFCFNVTEILEVEEKFEIRFWHVITQEGSRKFQTSQSEWPVALTGGGHYLRDIYGDLFRFPDLRLMSAASQKKLAQFVD